MISVGIFINNRKIAGLSAVRKSLKDDVGIYELPDGTLIEHKRSDGAKPLAVKILAHMIVPSLEESVNELANMILKSKDENV